MREGNQGVNPYRIVQIVTAEPDFYIYDPLQIEEMFVGMPYSPMRALAAIKKNKPKLSQEVSKMSDEEFKEFVGDQFQWLLYVIMLTEIAGVLRYKHQIYIQDMLKVFKSFETSQFQSRVDGKISSYIKKSNKETQDLLRNIKLFYFNESLEKSIPVLYQKIRKLITSKELKAHYSDGQTGLNRRIKYKFFDFLIKLEYAFKCREGRGSRAHFVDHVVKVFLNVDALSRILREGRTMDITFSHEALSRSLQRYKKATTPPK